MTEHTALREALEQLDSDNAETRENSRYRHLWKVWERYEYELQNAAPHVDFA